MSRESRLRDAATMALTLLRELGRYEDPEELLPYCPRCCFFAGRKAEIEHDVDCDLNEAIEALVAALREAP